MSDNLFQTLILSMKKKRNTDNKKMVATASANKKKEAISRKIPSPPRAGSSIINAWESS